MRRHALVFALVAFAGATLDLATKKLALDAVPKHGEISVIKGFFSIGHEHNPGVIWSFGPGAKTLWLIVSIVAIPLIIGVFAKSRRTWTTTICLGMIEAGTIGNCWDRIFHPGVRDFIKFYYVRANGLPAVWPLFNLADSCIVVGVILLSIELYFFDERKGSAPPKSDGAGNPAPSVQAFRERFRGHLVGAWTVSSGAGRELPRGYGMQFLQDGTGWFSTWEAARGETRESLEWRTAGLRCIEARLQTSDGHWSDWTRVSYDFLAGKSVDGTEEVLLFEPPGKGFWRSPLPLVLVPQPPPPPPGGIPGA